MTEDEKQPDAQRKQLGWLFSFWLAGATALGGIMGWLLALFIAVGTIGFGFAISGAVWGFCVGWAQKKLLERYIPHQDWSRWLSYTTAGAAGGWLLIIGQVVIGYFLEPIYPDQRLLASIFVPLAFFIGGSALGLAQWLALHHARHTVWWIVANAVGWGLGASIGLYIVEPFMPIVHRGGRLYNPFTAINNFVAGTVCIVIFSVVIGIALAALGRQLQTSSREVQ
jgi:MFS family permease